MGTSATGLLTSSVFNFSYDNSSGSDDYMNLVTLYCKYEYPEKNSEKKAQICNIVFPGIANDVRNIEKNSIYARFIRISHALNCDVYFAIHPAHNGHPLRSYNRKKSLKEKLILTQKLSKGYDKYFILGQSLGGYCSLEIAKDIPKENLGGIILVNSYHNTRTGLLNMARRALKSDYKNETDSKFRIDRNGMHLINLSVEWSYVLPTIFNFLMSSDAFISARNEDLKDIDFLYLTGKHDDIFPPDLQNETIHRIRKFGGTVKQETIECGHEIPRKQFTNVERIITDYMTNIL